MWSSCPRLSQPSAVCCRCIQWRRQDGGGGDDWARRLGPHPVLEWVLLQLKLHPTVCDRLLELSPVESSNKTIRHARSRGTSAKVWSVSMWVEVQTVAAHMWSLTLVRPVNIFSSIIISRSPHCALASVILIHV